MKTMYTRFHADATGVSEVRAGGRLMSSAAPRHSSGARQTCSAVVVLRLPPIDFTIEID